MYKTKYMAFCAVLILGLGASFLVACNDDKDEEEKEITPECALLSFSIDDIKTKHTTTLPSGKDTVVTVTTIASNYLFTVNQEKRIVYNVDSLTYGTNVQSVTANCTYSKDASLKYTVDGIEHDFSADDSIDFRKPCLFTVYSSDGKYKREYTVTVNVHSVNPDSSYWVKTTRPAAFDSWKVTRPDIEEDFLNAHSTDHLYCFGYPLKTNPSIERRIVVCYDDESTDSLAHVWTRLSTESNWSEMIPSSENAYGCPLLEHLCVVRYGGALYAFGGKSLNGRNPSVEPFERTYCSIDNGITWRTYKDRLKLPAELKGYADSFEAAVDNENQLWIVLADGTAWKGKLIGL